MPSFLNKITSVPLSSALPRIFLLLFLLLPLSAAYAKTLPDGLYARMETSRGTIVLKLHYQRAPITVANFVGLAEGSKSWRDPITQKSLQTRFYDGLSFHRVIKEFMIQGGDPLGNGSGGPGYQFMDEFHPELRHDNPGTLSMANAGPNTNGSQFFITHVPTPWLDDKHSVFGEVVEGMEVVNLISKGDLIKSVTIIRQGEQAGAFDPHTVEAGQQERLRKLAEKQRKDLPEITGKPDPKLVPTASSPVADEIALELLVIAYKGVRTRISSLYYDKEGAREVAANLSALARRAGSDFSKLVEKYTDLPQQRKIPVLDGRSENLPEFLRPAFLLEVGQISDPVDSPFGFLVFRRLPLDFVTAGHILVSYEGAMRATVKRSREEALKLARELAMQAKSGAEFAKLAEKNSDGPSAKKGGDLGRFTRGQMVPAFDKAVFALKPGEVSDVVETPFGFHVIKRFK